MPTRFVTRNPQVVSHPRLDGEAAFQERVEFWPEEEPHGNDE